MLSSICMIGIINGDDTNLNRPGQLSSFAPNVAHNPGTRYETHNSVETEVLELQHKWRE
jgi:hypothetical protein